jgi:cytochrome c oxidase subunit 2
LHGKHLISVALLWAGLTAIGELLVFADLFPAVGSHEAEDFDSIFRFLLILGIPVFTFVIAVVAYAALTWRVRGERPAEDGPPIRGSGWIPRIWLAVTGSLAVFVMIHPGLTGLAKLQSSYTAYGWGKEEADLEINATAFMWQWTFDYPDGTQVSITKGKEVVIPVNKHVRFNVNSIDVVHSLWIPAFRMKIDAVPGRTTFMTVHPTRLGDYREDQSYRVQCAELCGLDHGKMWLPVRVVTESEFEAWLASLKTQGN